MLIKFIVYARNGIRNDYILQGDKKKEKYHHENLLFLKHGVEYPSKKKTAPSPHFRR